jgi:hypothetical protein
MTDVHRDQGDVEPNPGRSVPSGRWPFFDEAHEHAPGYLRQAGLNSVNAVERLVPVPPMSPAGATAFSEIRASKHPPQALWDALQAAKVPVGDLPEMIANTWTWDDSPTSDLSEASWLEIFRAAGFFTYPPLVVPQADGSRAPLQRPRAPVTIYRGSTADRKCRMSWTSETAMADQLGARHKPYGAASLYKATVAPGAILAYLERRGEGWTIVIDPAELSGIERVRGVSDPR